MAHYYICPDCKDITYSAADRAALIKAGRGDCKCGCPALTSIPIEVFGEGCVPAPDIIRIFKAVRLSSLPPGVTNADIEGQMGDDDPYVETALEAIKNIFWGGWFDRHEQEVLAILERLDSNAYNEGLEAEHKPHGY